MDHIQDADIALLPSSWPRYNGKGCMEMADRMVKLASDAGKPLVVFTSTDRERDLPFDALHFRPSISKATARPGLFSMPGWTRDILHRNTEGQLVIRPKRDRPVVGFCGAVMWGVLEQLDYFKRLWFRFRRGRNPFDEEAQLMRWPARLRMRVVRLLAESPVVDTNFILNPGRKLTFNDQTDGAGSRQHSQDIYDRNMLDSDHILCVRGHGNYSFRFCECLSAGRIPVFVNTDCALPYDWKLNWKEYCVWVEEDELPQIGEKVAEFHSRLSDKDFVELQHACRHMWDEWVSPEGYFKNFHSHLELG